MEKEILIGMIQRAILIAQLKHQAMMSKKQMLGNMVMSLTIIMNSSYANHGLKVRWFFSLRSKMHPYKSVSSLIRKMKIAPDEPIRPLI